MTFDLPHALRGHSDDAAHDLLRRYFQPAFGSRDYYTGAAFDCWDSSRDHARAVNRFTADDLVAVSLLSVAVDPRAAHALLSGQAEVFTTLLTSVPADLDLADVKDELTKDDPAWQLESALLRLPRTDRTTASMLLARKRPRLCPIWDSVGSKVTGATGPQWEPMRVALRDGDRRLHRRLELLRDSSGLTPKISPLRILDVICWMEGLDRGF